MTTPFKIGFFFIAVIAMAALALGSVMMANQEGLLALLFFVLGFLVITIGFVMKRRVTPRK